MWYPRFHQLPIVSIIVLLLALPVVAQSNPKILYQFDNSAKNPNSALVPDPAGNLYGTSWPSVVFELSPAAGGGWTFNMIENFDPTAAFELTGSLLLDGGGNLYGTAEQGGASNLGLVYELSPGSGGTWTEASVFAFSGGHNGFSPMYGVLRDSVGHLYGVAAGGDNSEGVVYQLTEADGVWSENVLFTLPAGQTYPNTPLVMDSAGNLYFGNETDVFEVSPTGNGWTASSIYHFAGSGNAVGALTFDAKGNLYGTNQTGGFYGGGIAFELTPTTGGDWSFTLLHSFGGSKNGETDGSYPSSGLIFDNVGNPWGTTLYGGANNQGTVFRLTQGSNGVWAETFQFSFDGHDGALPAAGPLLLYQNNFYGVTQQGGIHGPGGDGIAYEFAPSLGSD